MTDFFQWLSAGSISSVVFIAVFSIVFVGIILIYTVAFFQGREISFWPLKIGSKPEKMNLESKNKDDKGLVQVSADAFFSTETSEKPLIEKAQNEVWIVQETGSLVIEQNLKPLELLIKKGGRVHVILVSDDTQIIDLVALRNKNLNSERISSRRKDALEKLASLVEKTKDSSGVLEVRQINYPLDITAAFIDPKSPSAIGLIRMVGFKNFFDEKRDFIITAEHESKTFNYFFQQLDEMWKLAGTPNIILTNRS